MQSPFSRVSMKEAIRSGLRKSLSASLSVPVVARLIGQRYRGRGVILMLHEFVQSRHETLGQGCTVAEFDAILTAFRKSGRDFVTCDEALMRLADPESRPFVALTFDDGYRSNINLALPVMERHGAPATIFVPTGMAERTINAWWLGLRELALACDSIDVEPMGMQITCADYAAKQAALERMTAWVWEDFSRAELLAPVFANHRISMPDLVDRLALDVAGVRAADRHPLIEIGAHTTTHRALRLLGNAEVVADIGDNKRYLETLLGRSVDWFAYPYGPPSIGGTREAEIVRKLGFRAAVTTDPGCLFPAHRSLPFLLPRQNAEFQVDAPARTLAGAEGVFRALSSRFGAPYEVPMAAGSGDLT